MKKLLSVLLLCAMVLSLVACGSSAKPASSSSAAPASSTSSSLSEATKTDNFPTKVITDIVPTSAGGSTDLYQRLIGTFIEKYLGQGFVVENKTGGAQVIGVTAIRDAAPDGYTIGVGWGASFAMRPYLLDVPYKMDDFTFICGVLEQKSCIIVRGDSEWNTLEDLTNAMKAKTLNYGAGAAGSYQYAWASYMMHQLDVSANMIPHNGDADAIVALQGGAVDWVCCETTSAVSALKSGDVKMLTALSVDRDPTYPDIPSFGELGYEADLNHSMSIVCPAGVPADRVEALRAAIEKTLKDPDFLKQAQAAGYNVSYKSGEECVEEFNKMAEIIKPMVDAGIFG